MEFVKYRLVAAELMVFEAAELLGAVLVEMEALLGLLSQFLCLMKIQRLSHWRKLSVSLRGLKHKAMDENEE
ncbi:hypothetical protein V6N13_090590 [Hibiscus sabdariffa]|uniref:Uncharacterized protein n=2 Tax=Hibiscus sabdariffa TaxID=183260 RepID=A0ABR2NY16_9ROSI